MNTEQNMTVTVETKQRGRKRNPALIRPIYLDNSNRIRGKGAPKPGSQVKVVYVQTSVKNSEFVYGVTPIAREETVTVPARKYKKVTVATVTTGATTSHGDVAPLGRRG